MRARSDFERASGSETPREPAAGTATLRTVLNLATESGHERLLCRATFQRGSMDIGRVIVFSALPILASEAAQQKKGADHAPALSEAENWV